ncbi:MAG: DUF2927 domain-containing protein [Pseudomonadota bacterium]
MFRRLFPLSIMFLTACMPSGSMEYTSRASALPDSLPPMKTFASAPVTAPQRSNQDIGRDFLDLTFRMESGRLLPYMTRFEGPITVRVAGEAPPSLQHDLTKLLARLRNEAQIDIRQTTRADANITVNVITRKTLQGSVPAAACFVVPHVQSWAEFRKLRRTASVDWARLKVRDKVGIFMPGDVSPQEIRDCLHEELAQALGPLNDLYRLPDSIFNDDNIHTVLTGFDMMILRAYYAPELRNGMTREGVARVLPQVLARINPGGVGRASDPRPITARSWIEAIEGALAPRASMSQRRSQAAKALSIAQNAGWTGPRRGYSHFLVARLATAADSDYALSNYLAADGYYRSDPKTRLHAAHVAVNLIAYKISAGEGLEAITMINSHIPVVRRSENANLLATLLMLKAEALEIEGRRAEAQAVRLDSLGWARYGFGSERDVRTRLNEITALTPVLGRSGG